MDKVEDVAIDDDGVFKYILIELTDKQGRKKNIVRGFAWAEYHADILDRVAPKLKEQELTYECLGGGRIRHDSRSKMISIYGYSVGFGMANHKITVGLLQKKYSNYSPENITFSNSGY